LKTIEAFLPMENNIFKQNLEERQALQLYLEETMDTMW
jgi:hypothetical protein